MIGTAAALMLWLVGISEDPLDAPKGASATVTATNPGSDMPPEVRQSHGPSGTSGQVPDDSVGYAKLMVRPLEEPWAKVAIAVAHPRIAAGTVVEVTALDTGRTIVALVVGPETAGRVLALSPGAARALGVGDTAAVRVRTVVANPQDQSALRSGAAGAPRLDAPPALLVALRRKLTAPIMAPAQLPAQSPAPRAAARLMPKREAAPPNPAVAPHGGFVVQVAALSSAERAAALARTLGGRVVPLGALYRVQMGPFADSASAQRARDAAARRGYGDARVFHTD